MEGFDSMIALWGYDYLEGLTAFLEGWIQVQDISSSLVGQLAAPKRVISSLMYALLLEERAFIWQIS